MVHTEQSTRATLADVLLRLAGGLEILPEPLAVEHRQSADWVKIQLGTLADWESWRHWLGANPVEPDAWKPSGMTGMTRNWTARSEWRGRVIELLYVEFRWDKETPAERRQRLARELDQLDQEIAARDPELAKC